MDPAASMATPCCLCNQTRYRPLYKVESSHDARPFEPVECLECGLVGLEPRLPLEELLSYYESLTERTDLEDKIRQRFQGRVRWVNSVTGGAGRLLDVGCSRGQFASAMKATGWVAEGVETDAGKAAAGEAEFGIKIHNVAFDEWQESEGTYDAITAWHVVEHFLDPGKVLAKAASLLAPESGRLFIEVPNHQALARVLGGPLWMHYDVPYHQHFFTRETLTKLAEANGLEVLWVSTKALDSDWWSVKRTLQRRWASGPGRLLRPLISIKPVAWMLAKVASWFGYTETFQMVARRRQ